MLISIVQQTYPSIRLSRISVNTKITIYFLLYNVSGGVNINKFPAVIAFYEHVIQSLLVKEVYHTE